jgi:hypothetical protein
MATRKKSRPSPAVLRQTLDEIEAELLNRLSEIVDFNDADGMLAYSRELKQLFQRFETYSSISCEQKIIGGSTQERQEERLKFIAYHRRVNIILKDIKAATAGLEIDNVSVLESLSDSYVPRALDTSLESPFKTRERHDSEQTTGNSRTDTRNVSKLFSEERTASYVWNSENGLNLCSWQPLPPPANTVRFTAHEPRSSDNEQTPVTGSGEPGPQASLLTGSCFSTTQPSASTGNNLETQPFSTNSCALPCGPPFSSSSGHSHGIETVSSAFGNTPGARVSSLFGRSFPATRPFSSAMDNPSGIQPLSTVGDGLSGIQSHLPTGSSLPTTVPSLGNAGISNNLPYASIVGTGSDVQRVFPVVENDLGLQPILSTGSSTDSNSTAAQAMLKKELCPRPPEPFAGEPHAFHAW